VTEFDRTFVTVSCVGVSSAVIDSEDDSVMLPGAVALSVKVELIDSENTVNVCCAVCVSVAVAEPSGSDTVSVTDSERSLVIDVLPDVLFEADGW